MSDNDCDSEPVRPALDAAATTDETRAAQGVDRENPGVDGRVPGHGTIAARAAAAAIAKAGGTPPGQAVTAKHAADAQPAVEPAVEPGGAQAGERGALLEPAEPVAVKPVETMSATSASSPRSGRSNPQPVSLAARTAMAAVALAQAYDAAGVKQQGAAKSSAAEPLAADPGTTEPRIAKSSAAEPNTAKLSASELVAAAPSVVDEDGLRAAPPAAVTDVDGLKLSVAILAARGAIAKATAYDEARAARDGAAPMAMPAAPEPAAPPVAPKPDASAPVSAPAAPSVTLPAPLPPSVTPEPRQIRISHADLPQSMFAALPPIIAPGTQNPEANTAAAAAAAAAARAVAAIEPALQETAPSRPAAPIALPEPVITSVSVATSPIIEAPVIAAPEADQTRVVPDMAAAQAEAFVPVVSARIMPPPLSPSPPAPVRVIRFVPELVLDQTPQDQTPQDLLPPAPPLQVPPPAPADQVEALNDPVVADPRAEAAPMPSARSDSPGAADAFAQSLPSPADQTEDLGPDLPASVIAPALPGAPQRASPGTADAASSSHSLVSPSPDIDERTLIPAASAAADTAAAAPAPVPQTRLPLPQVPQSKSRSSGIGRTIISWSGRVLRFGIFAALGYGILCLTLILVYRFVDPPTSNLMMWQRLTGTELLREWVPLNKISPNLIKAVIASEDARFCQHNGVDFKALRWALRQSGRQHGAGASTISMQVTKNLFLWNSRSYARKAIEIPLTMAMEVVWPKWRVMEVYLNIAEWGEGVFGAEAAASYHFSKPARRLSKKQAALLVVLLPNPIAREASDPSRKTKRRAARIIKRVKGSAGAADCVLN